jgi:hypothetical protein
MSGSVIWPDPANRIIAGHDVSCDPAKTPFDAQPMLMLVPMATNLSTAFGEPFADATVVGDLSSGAVVRVVSEHAAARTAAPRQTISVL